MTTVTTNNKDTSSSSVLSLSCWKKKKKNPLHVALLVCVCLACFGLGQLSCLGSLSSMYNNYYNNGDMTAPAQQQQTVLRHKHHSSSLAYDIVRKSFDESYALFLNSCSNDKRLQTCINDILRDRNNTDSPTANIPWWFRTMLRDSLGPMGLFGFWHTLVTYIPTPLQMCTIEKVGTKHWRQLFCYFNDMQDTETFRLKGVCALKNGTGTRNAFATMEPDAPKFVFLRDPLERFLSGFLDKCTRTRRSDVHCEPLPVFQNDENGMTKELIWNKRTFFEAYVDAMPLKWNMHFFPLALYCDGLYRHLSEYDFVGHMGPDFYDDVHALGQQLGPGVMEYLEKVFAVSQKRTQVKENTGVEGKAALNVEEYYTAKTVRRVLEYVSIDYITLNLTIPEWAHRMLAEEEEARKQANNGGD